MPRLDPEQVVQRLAPKARALAEEALRADGMLAANGCLKDCLEPLSFCMRHDCLADCAFRFDRMMARATSDQDEAAAALALARRITACG
jgi:hypothetical protein